MAARDDCAPPGRIVAEEIPLGLNLGARTALSLQLAILLALPVVAQSSERAPQESPWHVEKTQYYELYAKSTDVVAGARRDLDFAVGKFQQYFGEAPPLIAVLLFDSPADVQKYDYSDFVKRRVVFLPWVTAAGLQSAMTAQLQIVAFSDLGVMLMNIAGTSGASVMQTLPMGTVHEFAKGDVIVGVNHHPCTSTSDFQKLYGAILTNEKVELELRRSGQETTVTFAKPANGETSQVPFGSSPTLMTRAISHEAGHKYLQAWLRKRADAAAAANNAKPPVDTGIPEWFEETVATLFESPELQKGRKEFLSQRGDQLIPLEQLLAMANPAKASPSDVLKQPIQAGASQAGVVVKTSVDSASSEQGQLFYAETLSFGQFVSAKFGPTAIRDLAIGVTSGQTVEQVLGTINHSPVSLSELEAMWRNLIRK
jgi:hypothetical protein